MEVVLALVLLANVVAFSAHGLDKRRAARGGRRIPEKTLLALGVPLAAPGAWFGMSTFRHKTRKRSFQLKMVVVSAINVGLLYALIQLWEWGA